MMLQQNAGDPKLHPAIQYLSVALSCVLANIIAGPLVRTFVSTQDGLEFSWLILTIGLALVAIAARPVYKAWRTACNSSSMDVDETLFFTSLALWLGLALIGWCIALSFIVT